MKERVIKDLKLNGLVDQNNYIIPQVEVNRLNHKIISARNDCKSMLNEPTSPSHFKPFFIHPMDEV